MKKLLTLIVMMVMCLSAGAQEILGDSHAMVRLKQGSRVLLLPVQEKEEIANISVVDNRNETVKR
ncbi:MAG: DUF4980 domain-containing protein, partial [Prevotella sp.]|nr:DUF4980 domain-containing protein [Prevotella sp.]